MPLQPPLSVTSPSHRLSVFLLPLLLLLLACRDKLGKGEKVDDDLSDLSDTSMLAELAQSHKLAEAAAAAEADDWDDEDPMGAGQVHESGEAGAGAGAGAGVCSPAWVLYL